MEDTFVSLCNSIGVNRLEEGFASFVRRGQDLVIKGQDTFAQSGIGSAHYSARKGSSALVVDVGGTHTKVAICSFQGADQESWSVLFDRHNDEFRGTRAGKGALEAFAEIVGEEIVKAVAQKGPDLTAISGLSVIWSNALIATPLKSDLGLKGVSAVVSSYGEGNAYRKGEWFVEGLHNGFNLGDAFLNGFKKAGIRLEAFIIANDTVFTMKAHPNAHAGVVASSGANATAVDRLGLIRNTELGAGYELPDEFLSEGDRAFARDYAVGNSVRLEDLIAGKGLGKIYSAHIQVLAAAGDSDLKPIAQLISERGACPPEDLGGLLKDSDKPMTILRELVPEGVTREKLRLLGRMLVRRGGLGAAGLIAMSVTGQDIAAPVVAFDSSMGRHMPGYWEAVLQGVDLLTPIVGRPIKAILLQPHGMVTVPTLGAAYAVGDLLQ